MGRYNEKHLRQSREQGRGRVRGRRRGRSGELNRGRGWGLSHEDLRYMLQTHDVASERRERDVRHTPDTPRRVQVVHKGIPDEEVFANGSPTRETSGHPRGMYAVQEMGRNSRKDVDKGKEADVRFYETSKRYGSHVNDMMPSERLSRSQKRLHPDHNPPGPSFFRNDRSWSPDKIRRKKQKWNVYKEEDNSTDRGYLNQRGLSRKNMSPSGLRAIKPKSMKRNENGNVHDRMQSGIHGYNDIKVGHEMTTATFGVSTAVVQLVDSEERLKSSSTAEKEDLASSILRTICVDHPGTIDLANLRKTLEQKKIINFSNTRTLYEFLKPYDNVFEMEGDTARDERVIEDGEVEETPAEDKFLVTGHPKLFLCQQHSKKAGSCRHDCRGLHICKYFILSKCTMQEQGKKCIFGHDMDTEHNKEVMRKSLLHTFTTSHEIEVLRSLRYRNSTTVPAICSYYNKAMGCNNAECRFLHICAQFLHGACRSAFMCNSSHDIMAKQPLHCLQRYGICPSDGYQKEVVVKTLQSIATKTNHPVDQGRQDQSPRQRNSMFARDYNKTVSKPNNRPQVFRYFATNGITSERKNVSEKSTKESNQDGQLRVDVEEREEEREKLNLRNSSTGVWTWSWLSPDGAWKDVNDSQMFEDKYRKYMKARKRSFVINGKMCEVDFATKTGVISGEVALSFKRVRKPDCDTKYSTSEITDDSHVTGLAGSDEDADADVDVATNTDRHVTEVAGSDADADVDVDIDVATKSFSNVTGVAGSDAAADGDVATKSFSNVTDVAGSDMDANDVATKSDSLVTDVAGSDVDVAIKSDSHATDVAGSDVDVATKSDSHATDVAGSDVDVATKSDSHATDVAGSDVDVATKSDSHATDVAGSDVGVATKSDSHATDVAGSDVDVSTKSDSQATDVAGSDVDVATKSDSHATDVAGSDVDVSTKSDSHTTDVAGSGVDVATKSDSHATDVAGSDVDVATKSDSHATDVAGSDVDVATKSDSHATDVAVSDVDVATKSDSHATDVAGSDVDVATKSDSHATDVAGSDVDVATKSDSHATDVAGSDVDVSTKSDSQATDVAGSDVDVATKSDSHATDVAGSDVDVATKSESHVTDVAGSDVDADVVTK